MRKSKPKLPPGTGFFDLGIREPQSAGSKPKPQLDSRRDEDSLPKRKRRREFRPWWTTDMD